MSKSPGPLHWRTLLGGIVITVVGGIILYLIVRGFIEPTYSLVTPTTQATFSLNETPEIQLTDTKPATKVATLTPTIEQSTVAPSQTPIVLPTASATASLATETPTQSQAPCQGKIIADEGNAVQVRGSPEGPVSGIVYADTTVVVSNKAERNTGKWYGIKDENGAFLGWIQERQISSLSPNCPKH